MAIQLKKWSLPLAAISCQQLLGDGWGSHDSLSMRKYRWDLLLGVSEYSCHVMCCGQYFILLFVSLFFFFQPPIISWCSFSLGVGEIVVLSVQGWSSQHLFYQLCIALLTADVSLSKKTTGGSLNKTRIIGSLLKGLKLPQTWALDRFTGQSMLSILCVE